MKHRLYLYVAAILGIIFGIVAYLPFLRSRWIILPIWGIVSLIMGSRIRVKKQVMWAGLVYGACLLLAFMLAGFGGTTSQVPGFILLTAVLMVLGATCGFIWAYVGAMLRNRVGK